MRDSEYTYDEVIEEAEPAKQGDLGRFDIWELKSVYRSQYRTGGKNQYKLKYFVLDHDEERVMRETDWDLPDDHFTDGLKSSAFGFRYGYKTALEEINE